MVMLRGMPAATKPMNSGIDEHEQKGVTAPSKAARTTPAAKPRPVRNPRTRSGDSVVRSMPTRNTSPTSSNMILTVS
jgi:hypothetical protein